MTPEDGSGARVLNGDRERALERAMARHHNSGDALIEILHTAQELYGYLPGQVLKKIAGALKLPPSRVLGVATFYHLFRLTPGKEHSATVCLGTACYVAGGMELLAALRNDGGAKGADWTIGTGRCLGSCGLAPVAICDGQALSRVTPERLAERLKEANDSGNSGPDAAG